MAAFVSRYASAFLDVVVSAKLDTAAIDAQWNDFLSTWEASPELRDFFSNPSVPAIQKVGILDKLNVKLGLMKELRNLVAVLINNNRVANVAEVATTYRRLLKESQGIRAAEIVTSRVLGEAEREELLAEVAKLAGGKVDAKFKQDPAILGGTVVRVGSTVYDGSLRGRLDRLREELASS